ncbi:helix-turn-helix protein [Natranaerovirga hydrolytica]|uniref:Helix-turn-helix protein n=1 Tax=Natranaerovirga hydrolytica TaxID=680378 RepID=A0A4V2Q057_9FIRM|nr:helix-turn-helix transcriptional regulator [Natranaerovirga hydrolytica]TCK92421.1 helix-turn-helix protein [Natranaerovirga hydrolytica]
MKYHCDKVGIRIRTLREDNQLSREHLADILDLSDSYIGLIERGNRGITINNLVKIANYFNVSIEYFFEDRSNNSIVTSTRLKNLSNLIDSLDEEDYAFVLHIIKDMVFHIKGSTEK